MTAFSQQRRLDEIGKKIIRGFMYAGATAIYVIGAMLVLASLEGTGIGPHYILQEGYTYDARQAVLTLLFGEALVAGSILLVWLARQHK